MIKVDAGQEKAAYASLQKRPGIRDVYPLFGEFSFFLVMQAEKNDDLRRMMGEIMASRSVIKTSPVLVTAESYRRQGAAS